MNTELMQRLENLSHEHRSELHLGINAILSGMEFVKANTINLTDADLYAAIDLAKKIANEECVTIEELNEALVAVTHPDESRQI